MKTKIHLKTKDDLTLHCRIGSLRLRRNVVRATGVGGTKFVVPRECVLYIETGAS